MSGDRIRGVDPLPPLGSTLFDGTRLITVGGGAAVLGFVITIVAAVLQDLRQALFAWLMAFAFAITIALGALVFLMTVLAMSAKWPTLIRRVVEAVASPLPALAVFFVLRPRRRGPGLPLGSPQRHRRRPHTRARPFTRALILNVPFFAVRAAIFFVLWGRGRVAASPLESRAGRRSRARRRRQAQSPRRSALFPRSASRGRSRPSIGSCRSRRHGSPRCTASMCLREDSFRRHRALLPF